MLPAGFEPAILARERPQIHPLDGAATGGGINRHDFRNRHQRTGHCNFHISATASPKQNVRTRLLPSTRQSASWSQTSVR